MPANLSQADGLGVLQTNALFRVSGLSGIAAAWASIIPLACHLASRVYDHQLVGEVSLAGKLSIDLFPRLGTLKGISHLLRDGQDYFDRASSIAGSTSTVFDVNWGSVFPAANGAAWMIIAEYIVGRAATTKKKKKKKMPESIALLGSAAVPPESTSDFRRYQTLHILHFSRRNLPKKQFYTAAFRAIRDSTYSVWLRSFICLTGAVFASLFGCYGTGAALLCGSVTEIACYMACLQRPKTFLSNNEAHDACMLLAAHANSNTWYLFAGDRGTIDHLLNKPMVLFQPHSWLASWFAGANYIQLLAMTYVTAQQGWDGVCMVFLMVCTVVCNEISSTDCLAKRWLDREGVDIKTQAFSFSGRTQMVGAVQMCSARGVTSWMDTILADCPRRQVWLKRLQRLKYGMVNADEEEFQNLTVGERQWVLCQAELAYRAGKLLLQSIMRMTLTSVIGLEVEGMEHKTL